MGAALVAVLVWPEGRPPVPVQAPVAQAGPDNRVELAVTEAGFEPSRVRVHAGKPVTLVVTRQTDNTCATELVVPDSGVRVALPLRVPVTVTLVPLKSRTLRFGCGMRMMVSGVLLVE